MLKETPIEKRRAVIKKTVDYFIKNPDDIPEFTKEYKDTLRKIKLLKGAKDTKFAEVHGGHVTERHMLELPETLFLGIQAAVGQDFLQNKKEKAWFCKEFPQFLVSDKY